MAHLYPQAPNFLLIAFYDSQDCSGGILTGLQAGIIIIIIIGVR
jgi:hypothetical protein